MTSFLNDDQRVSMLQSHTMTTRHTLFISDLHLEPNQPHISKQFIYFMQHIAPATDALYVLGDLFEMWIGDDDRNAFHQEIIDQFHHLSESGVKTYFMRGNRDFFLGERFARECGGTLIADPTCILLYQQKIVLCHGDSLCTDDIAHQRLRKVTLSKLFHAIALNAPLSLRRWIGKKMRQQSRKRQQNLNPMIMDINEKAAKNLLEFFHSTVLIHGHTHRPHIHENSTVKRIVLGSWHQQGSFLMFPEYGEPVLDTVN